MTRPTQPTTADLGVPAGTHVDLPGTTHVDTGTSPHVDVPPVHVDNNIHIDAGLPNGGHADTGLGHVDVHPTPHVDIPPGPHIDTPVPPHIDVTSPGGTASKPNA